jgi:hypothetical protein
MADETPQLDENMLEAVGKLFEDFLTGLGSQLTAKVKELETQIEALEKQIATLIVGYGEQAVFMEALVAQISFASIEEREAFNKNVSDGRKEMLKVMQDATDTNLATEYPETASALADLVEEQLSDTDTK